MKLSSLSILGVILLAIFLSACQPASLPTPGTIVSSALPDLVVSYVNIAMQGVPLDTTKCVPAYTPYEVRVIIENRGPAPATNIQVHEFSTGYVLQIDELFAGQKAEATIPLSSPNGAYHIYVDPENLIPETDEDNNTAEYIAITPTPPILCLSTPSVATPFPDSSAESILWKTYQDDLHGFTFEYPAVYEEPAYQDLCGLKMNGDGIHLGQRIDLQILDPGGLGLENFARDLLLGKDWNVEVQTSQLISGFEGMNIQYRFGGTNRFGTIILVEHNGRIFVFNYSAGSFCDITKNQVQIFESAVYAHLLESFRFNK